MFFSLFANEGKLQTALLRRFNAYDHDTASICADRQKAVTSTVVAIIVCNNFDRQPSKLLLRITTSYCHDSVLVLQQQALNQCRKTAIYVPDTNFWPSHQTLVRFLNRLNATISTVKIIACTGFKVFHCFKQFFVLNQMNQ